MDLSSPAFHSNGLIPQEYTCEGKNISFPLHIASAPEQTVSFALIIEDPDAPRGTFDHWLAWNIPGTMREVPQGFSAPSESLNGFGQSGYGGPCPPPGKLHHYHIKVFALNAFLDLPKTASKEELLQEIGRHLISEAELIGTYKR